MNTTSTQQTGSLGAPPHHRGAAAGPDPYKARALGAAALFAFAMPVLLLIVIVSQPDWGPIGQSQLVLSAGGDRAPMSLGASTYASSCALCHGANAEGVARLGKPLRNSAYVQEHTDEQLFILIATGRMPGDAENTTGSLMPARGAQGLGDTQVNAVVEYLRTIQDPSQETVSVEAWNLVTDDDGTEVAGLIGGESGVSHDLFISSCSACHGAAGEGIEGLGKSLATSEFVAGKTDEELIKFIRSGRPIWDAENTSGIDMPPKGGNPAITDEQLADIVEYMRSIHD